MLAQGSPRPQAVAVCAGVCPASMTHGRAAGAPSVQQGQLYRLNGEKPRSRWTRKQTKLSLLVRLTYCGRNANYRVMRMTERPEGRLLTGTSEPCGHRLSGDLTG